VINGIWVLGFFAG